LLTRFYFLLFSSFIARLVSFLGVPQQRLLVSRLYFPPLQLLAITYYLDTHCTREFDALIVISPIQTRDAPLYFFSLVLFVGYGGRFLASLSV